MLGLSLINPRTITGDQVDELWQKLRTQDYYFNDTLRGRSDLFVNELFMPNSMHFRVEEYGILALKDITPNLNADVHFAFWEKPPLIEMYKLAKQLFGELFFGPLNIQRLTACIPAFNEQGQHLATILGFKLEGCVRRAILYNGEYKDVLIYGLLKDEFQELDQKEAH